MLPRDTEQVWNFLKDQPVLAGFVLVGGSALALRIGHRVSEDLDLAWTQARLPRNRLDALRRTAEAAGFRFQPNTMKRRSRILPRPTWICSITSKTTWSIGKWNSPRRQKGGSSPAARAILVTVEGDYLLACTAWCLPQEQRHPFSAPPLRLCSTSNFCKSARVLACEVPSTVFSAMSWTFW